jgi:hypothetical protein
VTTVSIDAIGVGAASFARLEIYDANNVLIERITSSELSDGEAATLTLSRPTAVIKSARAFGHAGTPVRLDHLRFGAATTATTDAHGAWSAPYLGSGNFRVEAVAPSGWNATTGGGSQSVSLAAGATVQNVTFGFHFTAPAWQNTDQPTDVNRDGVTNLTDLLLVVQHLRYHGFGAMSGEPEEGDPRIDVNGDGMASLQDLIEVINVLRDHMSGAGEGEATVAAMSDSAPSVDHNSPAPEGENLPSPSVAFRAQNVVFPGAMAPPSVLRAGGEEYRSPRLSLVPEDGPHDCNEEHEPHAPAAETHSFSNAGNSRAPSLEEILSDIAADVTPQWRLGNGIV